MRERSQQLYEAARLKIPGGVNSPVRAFNGVGGHPVFISRATCLPEIAGPHAFAFESFAPDAMAEIYEAGLAAWQADPTAADRGRRYAAGFAWSETALGYVRIYEALLAAASRA